MSNKFKCPLSHQDLATLQRIIDQRRDYGLASQRLSDASSTFTRPNYEQNVETDKVTPVNNESSPFSIRTGDHQNELFKPGSGINFPIKYKPSWTTWPTFPTSDSVSVSSENPELEILEIIPCNFPICTSTFSRYEDRNRHEEEFHTIPNQYPCPIPGCPWLGSTRLNTYEDHMTTMHIESAPISKSEYPFKILLSLIIFSVGYGPETAWSPQLQKLRRKFENLRYVELNPKMLRFTQLTSQQLLQPLCRGEIRFHPQTRHPKLPRPQLKQCCPKWT